MTGQFYVYNAPTGGSCLRVRIFLWEDFWLGGGHCLHICKFAEIMKMRYLVSGLSERPLVVMEKGINKRKGTNSTAPL